MNERAPNIETLIQPDDTARDRHRLRSAHAALLRAGPLPELPLSVRRPPPVTITQLRITPHGRSHRHVFAAAAAALLLAASGAGYLLSRNQSEPVQGAVAMHATWAAPHAQGMLRIGARDRSGNWPITLHVRDLPPLPAGSYYAMYLTNKGRLVGSCGAFKTNGSPTIVHLNVPYTLSEYSGWIIRRQHPNSPPSPPLLTS